MSADVEGGTSVVPEIGLADLPLRDELRGQTPYGAPQLDVPVQLNVNENPYPPSKRVVEAIAAAVAVARGWGERWRRGGRAGRIGTGSPR